MYLLFVLGQDSSMRVSRVPRLVDLLEMVEKKGDGELAWVAGLR